MRDDAKRCCRNADLRGSRGVASSLVRGWVLFGRREIALVAAVMFHAG